MGAAEPFAYGNIGCRVAGGGPAPKYSNQEPTSGGCRKFGHLREARPCACYPRADRGANMATKQSVQAAVTMIVLVTALCLALMVSSCNDSGTPAPGIPTTTPAPRSGGDHLPVGEPPGAPWVKPSTEIGPIPAEEQPATPGPQIPPQDPLPTR